MRTISGIFCNFAILALAITASAAPPPQPVQPIRANPFSTNSPNYPITNSSPLIQSNAPVSVISQYATPTNDWASTFNLFRGLVSATNRMNGALNVRAFPYRCAGDGVTDDTAGLQAAINDAISYSNSVFLASGEYRITAPLTNANSMRMFGVGRQKSVIVAGAPMTYMLRVASTSAEDSRSSFDGFQLNGAGLAVNGIYSDYINHAVFNEIRTTGTTGWGINIGFGWCNAIMNSECSYSSGGGIKANSDKDFGGNNALLIQNCKVFLNDGIGIQLQSGYNMNLIGNTVESNAVTGLMLAFQCKSVNIVGGYFEQNGAVGHTFTNSGTLLKSQILINGRTSTNDMGYAFPCENVSIKGVFMSDDSQHTDSFVFASGVEGLEIDGITLDEGGSAYLLKVPLDKDYGNPTKVTIGTNKGFTDNVLPIMENPDTAIDMQDWVIKGARPQTYASSQNYDWEVFDGPGTIIQNAPIFEGFQTMAASGLDNNSIVGTVIDLDRHTELRGKLAQISAWVKTDGTNQFIMAAYISNRGQGVNFNNSTNAWQLIQNQSILESSGTMVLGFKAQNMGTNVMYIANPVISVVGVPPATFFPKVEPMFVRKNGYDLQIGTWSGNGWTNLNVALTANDLTRWRIMTNGTLIANGANDITTTGNINAGSGTYTSHIFLPNDRYIQGRNVANDGYYRVIGVNPADLIEIAGGGIPVTVGAPFGLKSYSAAQRAALASPVNGWLVYQNDSTPAVYAYVNGSWTALGGGGGSGSITASGYTMNTARLLGRTTASAGAIEEITVGSGLSLSGGSLTATGGTTINSIDNRIPFRLNSGAFSNSPIQVVATAATWSIGTHFFPDGANQDIGTSVNPVGTLYTSAGLFNGTLKIVKGAGSPEGSLTADVGSLYQRTDGGPGTTLYGKETGTGNTGWLPYGRPATTWSTMLDIKPTTVPTSDFARPDGGQFCYRVLYLTNQAAIWQFRMPRNYASGLQIDLGWKMESATSGSVAWSVEVWAISPGDSADVNTPSFATANVQSTAVPGTAGFLATTTVTCSNDDSVAANDYVQIRLKRVDSTITTDASLVGLTMNYTPQ